MIAVESEKAFWSTRITKETRRESHKAVDKQRLYSLVLVCLGQRDMTAREIADELYKQGKVIEPTRQAVQPRLTELMNKGLVEVVGKKHDRKTDRNVALYRMVVSE